MRGGGKLVAISAFPGKALYHVYGLPLTISTAYNQEMLSRVVVAPRLIRLISFRVRVAAAFSPWIPPHLWWRQRRLYSAKKATT